MIRQALSKSCRLIKPQSLKSQLSVRPLITFHHDTSTSENGSLKMAATAAAAATLLVAGSCSQTPAMCEEQEKAVAAKKKEQAPVKKENPLWPSGVPPEMVNRYVDEILGNPEINISAIPDSVERLIYVSTVRLTLNALYKGLGMLHGQEILGHLIELEKTNSNKVLDLKHSTGKINSQQLHELADRLLKNKAVNQRWLPDFVERQVYLNCLKLVFSLLDKIADTLSIRLCGHELSLSFEPLQDALKLTSGEQEPMVINQDILDALVSETIEESEEADSSSASILSRLPFYQSFIRDLHKTLYTLILGILGDMLAQTELAVLEDRVQVRLVPMDIESWRQSMDRDTEDAQLAKIQELEKQLEEAHDAEARARNVAAIGLLTAAITTTVAAILHLEG